MGISATIDAKEDTRERIKKAAAHKYGVPESYVTITSLENVVEGIYTATATVKITLKMFLTYVFMSPAQRVKVYGSAIFAGIGYGVCAANEYSLWYTGGLMILMWVAIIYGSWRNFIGKTA